MLLAEIKGPSGQIKTNVETPMPHRTRVCFTPLELGEYAMKFTWNRVILPNSPVVGVTSIDLPSDENNHTSHNKSRASSISSSGSGGDHKVILTGKGLAKAVTGTGAKFTIDGSRAGPGIDICNEQVLRDTTSTSNRRFSEGLSSCDGPLSAENNQL
jgi:filamin